jgi:hypothetical protein
MRSPAAVCAFVAITTLSFAQSDDLPSIFRPLSAIADSPLSRDVISLVDRDAIPLAYPDARKPSSTSALVNALIGQENVTQGEAVWALVFRGLLDETAQTVTLSEDLPEALGIEVLQIGQVATFGSPPANGTLFTGDFDLHAVYSALAARGYTTEDELLWCYEGDCTNGLQVNPGQRNPANPFGGSLGRTQPVIVAPGLLYSAASEDVVRSGAAAAAGEVRSVADVPVYRAVAAALASQGVVLQTTFLDGRSLLESSLMNLSIHLSGTPQPLPAGIAPIDPYILYAVADVVTPADQAGIVAFAYASEASATAALEQMAYRLTVLNSQTLERPWAEVLADRSLTVEAEVVAAQGFFVGLLRFATPLPTTADLVEGDSHVSSSGRIMPGQVYNFLVRGLYNRDDAWRLWDPGGE